MKTGSCNDPKAGKLLEKMRLGKLPKKTTDEQRKEIFKHYRRCGLCKRKWMSYMVDNVLKNIFEQSAAEHGMSLDEFKDGLAEHIRNHPEIMEKFQPKN
jgi:hypothetical protein